MYFVNRSAGLSLPRTLLKLRRCCAAVCCTHSRPVSMCRVLPNPFLFIIPIAALASLQISPFINHPMSFNMAGSPSVSAAAFRVEYNSLSPELKAMNDCVLLLVLIICFPIVIHPPVVDFLVSRHPAQSASEYALTLDCAGCQSYHCINLLFPFR